jgi:hypothetical protein
MQDIRPVNDKSHKTAITRRGISAPMRHLVENELLIGSALDYGCGKGQCAIELEMDKYDPHFWPTAPQEKYDTVTCHYVLNVMDEAERNEVIESILSLLNPKGKAYITVRRDIKSEGFTSRGTYQENVRLDLPIVKELKNAYCIYELTL